MSNLIKIFLLAMLLTSCNDKIIKKEIVTKDLKVICYYYSYITNTSDAFIELEINNKSYLITKTFDYDIGEIYLSNDTIFIERAKTKSKYDSNIFLEGNIFGYVIKYKIIERK